MIDILTGRRCVKTNGTHTDFDVEGQLIEKIRFIRLNILCKSLKLHPVQGIVSSSSPTILTQ